MKQIFTFCFTFCFALISWSQNFKEKCATMPVYQKQLQNEQQRSYYQQAETAARAWLSNPVNQEKLLNKQNSVIQIPVVVHVVYKDATQNIPDSNIYSQIAVLNECYSKMNSNYSNTRSIFDSLGVDIEIQFALATIDPSGQSTTGIVRVQAPSGAAFDPIFNNDKVKFTSSGGDDAWPACNYLNFWVCDMSVFGQAFVLGYAQFPGGDPATDGVVIQTEYFGRNSTPHFSGKTAVHETGHWLGMRHIWADDTGCDSTDFVDDTPNAGDASQTDCNTTKNTCSSEAPYWGTLDPPDMVENYMDYSSDSCMTLFTKGQKARMYAFLNTDPYRIAIKDHNTSMCSQLMSVTDIIPDFQDKVTMVPNPAKEFIKLNFKGISIDQLKYEIFDVSGRKLYEDNIVSTEQMINTSKFSSGIYFLRIFNGANSTIKKLIIE